MNRETVFILAILAAFLALTTPLSAAEPLHAQVDRLIEQGFDGKLMQPAAAASDQEFVRRAYLDFAGMVPTAAQVQAFLQDSDSNKRARLVDQLLDSPEFPRRLQKHFDVMLMERRGGKAIPQPRWEEYLRKSFAEGKPYDQLVREMLTEDGTSRDTRPAAKFFLDRGAEADLMVRDIGRIFLGIDLQCAQCHDHPIIGDYAQRDYFGLYAFVSRSFVFTDAKQKKAFVAEKAGGEVSFKSVFDPDTTNKTGARILAGAVIEEPTFAKGNEYFVKPDKKKKRRPIPKFSIRAKLGESVANRSVPQFSRNLVNRVWAMLMGRGLVHPLDLHHSDNPPSHPKLLDLLAREFESHGYNIRWLVRELALSQTYQRSSQVPPGKTADDYPPDRFALALLKPLSPEQLAWSLMQVSGQVQAQRDAARKNYFSDPRLRDILTVDEKRRKLGETMIEQAAYGKLSGQAAAFVKVFGGAPGQLPEGFEATADGALFLSNSGQIQNYVRLTARQFSGQMEEPAKLADQLFLTVLARLPQDAERKEVVAFLNERPAQQRAAALEEVTWALLTSAEFRFNH